MTRVAYVDESQRGRDFYALAAIAVPHGSVETVRKELRDLAPKGVARRHFHKESQNIRKAMLDVFLQLPAASYVCVTSTTAPVIKQRAKLLTVLAQTLATDGLDRLWLDHVDTVQQHRDRQVLAKVLAGSDVEYGFCPPHSTEPMLWVPDAVAWCAGAKREWSSRLNGWVTTINVA